jgi:mannose-6-phosphate isomerase-like protein (cupin superfamily)
VRELAPGASTDWSAEQFKEKMIYVLDGHMHVEIAHMAGTLKANDYQHVPAQHRHRFSNTGSVTARYFEFVCFDPTAPAIIRPEDQHMVKE